MSTSPALLTFLEKLIKYEPLYYVVKGGLMELAYWKYEHSTHELQLYVSHQFDLMEQQGKHFKEIYCHAPNF
jgi:hypothetical protein